MKKAALAVALLLVVAIAYEAGRRRGRESGSSASTNSRVLSWPIPQSLSKGRRATKDPHVDALDRGAPFAQNMTSAERGYQAAALNLDEALSRIASLPVAERMGFTTGIFSFVARNHTPADALKIYEGVPEAFRANALRALVGEWIYTRSPLDEEQRYIKREGTMSISGSRAGLELELASMLASAQADPELASAWLDAFANHSSRSEMLLTLSHNLARNDVDALLARTEGWTDWEKERVTQRALATWSYKSPKEAWEWYQANGGQFDQDLSSGILGPWAGSDLDAVKRLLPTIQDAGQRKIAVETIAKLLAEKNTDAAIA